jgi:hypothetical protein
MADDYALTHKLNCVKNKSADKPPLPIHMISKWLFSFSHNLNLFLNQGTRKFSGFPYLDTLMQ